MMYDDVEWLIDCTPRPVQLEAMRRSFYGYALYDGKDATPEKRQLYNRPVGMGGLLTEIGAHNGVPRTGPAVGWAHYLEMRLGKTPTVLNEYALLRKYYGVERLIILSPNSYKLDWYNEIPKFGLGVPVLPYETSYKKATVDFLRANKGEFAVVLNYEGTIQAHTQAFLEEMLNGESMLVLDESIRVKNPQALSTNAVHVASLGAKWVRELSGLPMTQGPQDLFSQFRTMRAVPGSSFYSFRNTFCKMGGFKNKKVVGARNEEALQNLIRSTSFVAKRKDWTTVTVPEYYTVSISLSKEQQAYYDEMNKNFIVELDAGKTVSASQVVTQMMKLQQISSGFLYGDNKEAIEIVPPEKTSKMVKLLEMLEDEIEGKVVVPFHYTKSGEALLRALEKYSPAVIWSQEKMTKMELDAITEKKKFNTGQNGCRVILVQISAGKYGHDLSGVKGDRTSYMFFYENTWSLDDRGQIEARITVGDGQDWPTVYMDFVSSKVEAKPIEALQKKENLVSAILGAFNPGKTRDSGTYDFRI